MMLVVDADKKIRYERATKRGSHTDSVTFEEFIAQEDMEMTSKDSTNPSLMNTSKVMRMADFKLENNGTVEELHAQINALPIFN